MFYLVKYFECKWNSILKTMRKPQICLIVKRFFVWGRLIFLRWTNFLFACEKWRHKKLRGENSALKMTSLTSTIVDFCDEVLLYAQLLYTFHFIFLILLLTASILQIVLSRTIYYINQPLPVDDVINGRLVTMFYNSA